MSFHEIELSDNRIVTVLQNGDHWVLQILSENHEVVDTYEEDTSQTIDPFEQKIASLLTNAPESKVGQIRIGPAFPKGGKWLTEKHELDWDDAMKVLRIITDIVFGEISEILDE